MIRRMLLLSRNSRRNTYRSSSRKISRRGTTLKLKTGLPSSTVDKRGKPESACHTTPFSLLVTVWVSTAVRAAINFPYRVACVEQPSDSLAQGRGSGIRQVHQLEKADRLRSRDSLSARATRELHEDALSMR